jgi:hypothetical protein
VDRETLRSLRAFQIDYLRDWLRSEEATALWVRRGQAAVERAMAQPLSSLVDDAALDSALEQLLADATAGGVVGPMARVCVAEGGQFAAGIEMTIASVVGTAAREAIEALVAHPEIIDVAMVRAIARDPAMEAVMRDVLFEALVAFNERTNPFVAPWGVPALLDALPRVGRATIRKTFDRVRSEFERRLEPEMRRFLEGFANKSVERMVDIFADKAGEPELVALRQHAVAVILDESVAEVVWPTDDPRHGLLEEAVAEAAAHALVSLRAPIREAVAAARQQHADRAVGAILEERGIAQLDVEPWLRSIWPGIRDALMTEDALADAAALIDETHEAWLATRQA